MLFNSTQFIFVFLPLTFITFFVLSHYKKTELALSALVVFSILYYGWWKVEYVFILLGSLLFNFIVSRYLLKLPDAAIKKIVLIIGVFFNLSLIAYFKYTNFALDIVHTIFHYKVVFLDLVLPLGISFFTFQQIAYLVDTYKGLTKEHRLIHYCLFVTFFPQLIAGPIVHYSAVMPQFENRQTFQFNVDNLNAGLIIFTIGLFKKAVFADSVASFSDPVFNAVDHGAQVTTFESWSATLAYTLQLYFDFSGYSDMAIGLALMFGIRLPINFNSPYQADNIIEFWRRWHMTLSRFLRDYVYIPLGGNRKGLVVRHFNLMITMLLGGLWHGAGWNFIIWGGLHGLYLVINHTWHNIIPSIPVYLNVFRIRWFAFFVTFLAVALAWVFFRATTLQGSAVMLNAMFMVDGFTVPADVMKGLKMVGHEQWITWLQNAGVTFYGNPGHIAIQHWLQSGLPLILALLVIVWVLPNSIKLVKAVGIIKGEGWQINAKALNSRMGAGCGYLAGLAFFIVLSTLFSTLPSQFLYFNF